MGWNPCLKCIKSLKRPDNKQKTLHSTTTQKINEIYLKKNFPSFTDLLAHQQRIKENHFLVAILINSSHQKSFYCVPSKYTKKNRGGVIIHLPHHQLEPTTQGILSHLRKHPMMPEVGNNEDHKLYAIL